MNDSFPRIITLLRKERGISQKAAAQELGISQALLSHYEKGIRECGLDFLTRTADFYGVSVDYLLGRTPERSGARLTLEDLPEPDAMGKENAFRGSVLPLLHKKLIFNSLNIVFDKLQKSGNKGLIHEVSAFLMMSVYRMLRVLYRGNSKNPDSSFAVPAPLARGKACAEMEIAEARAIALVEGTSVDDFDSIDSTEPFAMSPELLGKEYPLFASSLSNLVQNCESRIAGKTHL
ncbi:MAG: helix-turn-helix transcriptional regulator [Clostridiales bacterium]|nr:helix-turn-helix transcriptional regulator [Clostridiales bacterium]